MRSAFLSFIKSMNNEWRRGRIETEYLIGQWRILSRANRELIEMKRERWQRFRRTGQNKCVTKVKERRKSVLWSWPCALNHTDRFSFIVLRLDHCLNENNRYILFNRSLGDIEHYWSWALTNCRNSCSSSPPSRFRSAALNAAIAGSNCRPLVASRLS